RGSWPGRLLRDTVAARAGRHASPGRSRMARPGRSRVAPAQRQARLSVPPHPASVSMIRFANITKAFGEGPTQVEALRDLSLDVPARQFCAIMGPSGSGKSTVLHLVAALTKPTSGEIYLGDRPLSRMTERDAALMRRRELGFIFQFFHLIH